MKTPYTIFVVTAAVSVAASTLYGQQTQISSINIKPDAPTAAQFLRYDEMPVSEYTGIPNISVPLFEINEDGVKLPLTLSYHAGGIKVNQDASWVGLGWDLSLGSIVQIINDEDDLSFEVSSRLLPDFCPAPYQWGKPSICHTDYPRRYKYPSTTPGEGWTENTAIQAPQLMHSFKVATGYYLPVNGNFSVQYESICSPSEAGDSEPDIFKANFLGESFTFIMDFKAQYNSSGQKEQKFVILNKKGYLLEKNGNEWIVTNPSGVKFYFTTKVDTRSSTITSRAAYSKRSVCTWLLNKIVTPLQKEITIEYHLTDEADTELIHTDKLQKVTNSYTGRITFTLSGSYTIAYISSYFDDGTVRVSTKSKEKRSYIKKISFPGGTVDFTLSNRSDITGTKKLDKLEISNKKNEVVKTVKFNYDYFIEKKENNVGSTRLRLSSLTENDISTHTFRYNSTQLPPRNSLAQDYWGYYNGHSGNTSLVPNPARFGKSELPNNNNNKSANLPYTKAAVLEEMVFPTGGKVCFNYALNEFNTYWVPDYATTGNTVSKGLGLRIESVLHKDKDDGILKKTTYEYSGGKASLMIHMFKKMSSGRTASVNPIESWVYLYNEDYTEVSNDGVFSSNPLSSFNGVGYDRVTKKVWDGNNFNGKTESSYCNNPDIVPDMSHYCTDNHFIGSLPAFKDTQHPANGSLKEVKYYDSTDKVLRKESYEYDNVVSDIYYGARITSHTSFIYCTGMNTPYLAYTPQSLVGFYPIVDFESLQKKKETKEYFGNDSLTTTLTYTYNAYNIVSSFKVTTSEANKDIDYLYSYPTKNSSNAVLKDMFAKNRIAEVISISKYRNTAGGLYHHGKTYNQFGNKILVARLDISEKITGGQTKSIYYDRYDDAGNLLQMRGIDNIPVVYLWGYDNQYPIAEITNASYEDVCKKIGNGNEAAGRAALTTVATKSEPSAGDLQSIDNLRILMPEASVTTYTCRPLAGIKTITDPQGIKTTCEYDSFNRLQYIKDRLEKMIENYDYHYQNQ